MNELTDIQIADEFNLMMRPRVLPDFVVFARAVIAADRALRDETWGNTLSAAPAPEPERCGHCGRRVLDPPWPVKVQPERKPERDRAEEMRAEFHEEMRRDAFGDRA